jgi:hypothetical protein
MTLVSTMFGRSKVKVILGMETRAELVLHVLAEGLIGPK